VTRPFDLDHLYDRDPRPFYRSVLSSTTGASDLLDEHPINHRPILVWNAAMKSIRHWFGDRSPGRKPRQAFIDLCLPGCAWIEAEMHIDAATVVDRYIEATFHPKDAIPRLVKIPMDPLCETGLVIPSVLGSHYAWKNEGEREALIMCMYLFDHTYANQR
jgi:hypothetical protein